MSLYYKEKPEYVVECFDSLLNQTVKATEWIIVEDGPLTPELYEVLDTYEHKYPKLIKRVPLKENGGLGNALAIGIKHCSNELIARMDTDDIAVPFRFEIQLEMFNSDPNLDICGGQIREFSTIPEEWTTIRAVPLKDKQIKKYHKYRDGFNHMTVMYKKSAVLSAGNYKHALLMEDTLLWANMFMNGVKAANSETVLVYARTGKDMIERRGGFKYFIKYKKGRKQVYKTGFINKFNYLITIFIQFIVALVPMKARKFIFDKLLRR